MAVTRKWVHRKFWAVDGVTPATGSVTFTMSAFVSDATDDEMFAPGSVTVPLSSGEILTQLRVNDDPQDNPTDTAWTESGVINGKSYSRTIQILSTDPHGDTEGDPIELEDLTPTVASPDYGSYASASSLAALAARMDQVEAEVGWAGLY